MQRKRTTQRRQKRIGFTLLEVLIVLAIIGVIAAMAIPQLLGQQKAANIKITKTAISNLENAAKLYAVGNSGEPPTSVEEMMKEPADGTAPLLDKIPTDAWNVPLHYEYPNGPGGKNNPSIWSNGPNDQKQYLINNWEDKQVK